MIINALEIIALRERPYLVADLTGNRFDQTGHGRLDHFASVNLGFLGNLLEILGNLLLHNANIELQYAKKHDLVVYYYKLQPPKWLTMVPSY